MAGFVDGEGSIGIYSVYKYKYGDGETKNVALQVSNTEKELVNLFKERFGGGITTVKPKMNRHGSGLIKSCYVWYLHGGKKQKKPKQRMQKCLLELLPYLRSPIKIHGVVESLKFLEVPEKYWKNMICD